MGTQSSHGPGGSVLKTSDNLSSWNEVDAYAGLGFAIQATRQAAFGIQIYQGFLASGWTVDGNGLIGNAGSPTPSQSIILPFAGRYQGAKIASVDVFFKSTGHTSLPANFPSFNLFTLALPTAGSVAATSCGSGTISAPDIPTYEAMTSFNFSCSNPVVVSDANTYFLQITDEHGSGAVAGIRYYGCRVNFSGGSLPE